MSHVRVHESCCRTGGVRGSTRIRRNPNTRVTVDYALYPVTGFGYHNNLVVNSACYNNDNNKTLTRVHYNRTTDACFIGAFRTGSVDVQVIHDNRIMNYLYDTSSQSTVSTKKIKNYSCVRENEM